MSWALPYLFIQLIVNVRGPHVLTSITPEPMWLLLIVSVVLLFMSIMANHRSLLSLWPRFQRRAVQ